MLLLHYCIIQGGVGFHLTTLHLLYHSANKQSKCSYIIMVKAITVFYLTRRALTYFTKIFLQLAGALNCKQFLGSDMLPPGVVK